MGEFEKQALEGADLKPWLWWRYIDDGLCRIPKNNKNECQLEVLNKLNSMDMDIKWTSDPIGPLTPFLDLEISETGTVKTYHKPSSGQGRSRSEF